MGIINYLREQFTAVTFAEAGEFDTAREILEGSPTLLDEVLKDAEPTPAEMSWAAVAFAEAGEFDTAREMLETRGPRGNEPQEVYPRRAVAGAAR